uniref:PIH1 N-terminal domain-containing protein n=1 Tax=Acrobeloides nanus TaxID=290746 RepID=A0A914C256_9BILA
MSKRQLVVDPDDDYWLIYPTPGYVLKFRNVDLPKNCIGGNSGKFFLNICHCIELPGPPKDLEEDEVVEAMQNDPNSYGIPVSIGTIDEAVDNQGEIAPKIDILVNSDFFNKRMKESEFFRQMALVIICELVESKYGIKIDPRTQVKLKNKKVMGELGPQQVRKKPRKVYAEDGYLGNEEMPSNIVDVDDLEAESSRKPRNYRVQILDGTYAQIQIKVKDEQEKPVQDLKRLSLKMNDDRVVLILDKTRTVADFFIPYSMVLEKAESDFDAKEAILTVKCPILW